MPTPPDFSVGQYNTAAYMNAIGLWKITDVSFTNQSRVDFLNVFSSDFVSYRAEFHHVTSNSSDEVYLQLRSTSGLITSSDYLTTRIEGAGDGSLNSFYSGGGYVAQWRPTFCETGSNRQVNGYMDIFRPNESATTTFVGQFHRLGSLQYVIQSVGYFQLTTQLTGFSIGLGTAQTFSGRVSIYGYRN